MYLRAGLLDASGGQGVLAAIAADPDLNIAQKQSLTQIYETFRRENTRSAGDAGEEERVTFAEPTGETGRKASRPETGEPAPAKASTARRSKTAGAAATRKTAPRRTAASTATGGADDTATPARKPRKAAKRQPRTTRPESSSEAPSVEGSGAKDAKERTEETA
jgi:hypothetical protein